MFHGQEMVSTRLLDIICVSQYYINNTEVIFVCAQEGGNMRETERIPVTGDYRYCIIP